MVDLFACEIITLCRVGTVVGFVEGMIEQHKALGEPKKPTITAKPEDPARFNSEENYFPVFEANARDLQILEADVVKHVTEFYTYMKATRDMLRLLGEVRANHASVAVEDEAIVNVIYMVFLGYESARLAIDDLIEFEPTHAESKIVLLFTELRAFHFLQNFSATYKSTSDTAESLNQIRKKRLELRRDNYKEIVPELLRRVRSHAGEPKWLKAGTMVDGLQQLYDQYFPDPRPVSVLPTQPPPAANAA